MGSKFKVGFKVQCSVQGFKDRREAIVERYQLDADGLPDIPRVARRTTMGLTSDSFQSIRFATPQRLLAADRLLEIAARVGAGGAHGGMTAIDMDWARATRRLKESLGLYLEIQTFLPREDPAVFEHAVKVAKEAGAS